MAGGCEGGLAACLTRQAGCCSPPLLTPPPDTPALPHSRLRLPALAAWVLAERIGALGRLLWDQGLHTQLPAALLRPADVAFWALFAAAVAWPLW